MVDDPANVIEARENFDADFARFREAYLAFIEYVKSQYLDIDLRQTNQISQESLPLPPRISEDEEAEETESEPDESATAESERQTAQSRRASCLSWIKRFAAVLVGLAAVAGCVVTIIILF